MDIFCSVSSHALSKQRVLYSKGISITPMSDPSVTTKPALEEMETLFQPPPFSDASKEIRLLHVYPGNGDDSIICDMAVFDASAAPAYGAISYTWGNPIRSHTILINDQSVTVGENCYYAFWQVRFHGFYEYYWIDALCIDQENVAEKNHQVANMDLVYKRAACVYACVGEAANDSDALLTLVRDLTVKSPEGEHYLWEAHYSNIEAIVGAPVADYPVRDSTVSDEATCHQHADPDQNENHMKLLTQSFSEFAIRPYWQRAWIVQELYLAKSAVVLCGIAKVDLDDLVAMRLGLQTATYRRHESLPPSSRASIPMEVMKMDYGLIDFLNTPRTTGTTRGTGMVMRTLSRSLRAFRCFDPRDRVYSLLAMISDHRGVAAKHALRPDYGESLLKLATRVLDFEWGRIQLYDVRALLEGFGIEKHTMWPVDQRPVEAGQTLRVRSHQAEQKQPCSAAHTSSLGTYPPRTTPRHRQAFLSAVAELTCVDGGFLTADIGMATKDFVSEAWLFNIQAIDQLARSYHSSDRPAALFSGSTLIALVPASSQHGDHLVSMMDHSMPTPGEDHFDTKYGHWTAVIRHHRGDIYEIIGPAVLHPACDVAYDYPKPYSLRNNTAQAAPPVPKQLQFTLVMDTHDVLLDLFHGWDLFSIRRDTTCDSKAWMQNWTAMRLQERFSSYCLLSPPGQHYSYARAMVQDAFSDPEKSNKYLWASSDKIEHSIIAWSPPQISGSAQQAARDMRQYTDLPFFCRRETLEQQVAAARVRNNRLRVNPEESRVVCQYSAVPSKSVEEPTVFSHKRKPARLTILPKSS